MLRIILEDDDIRKLVVPFGIPSSLQDLHDIIQATFHIPKTFNVMYQDKDFDGQFFTLSSIEDVHDKDTLKLVFTQPIVLNFSPVGASDVESFVPEQSSDTSSGHSSGSQDTILLSSSDESGPSFRSQPWPAKFPVPAFSYDVDLVLEAGNKAYQKDGTLLNNPTVTSSILERLAEAIFSYTAYPDGLQVLAVVEALVEKYPCLKEPGSFNGLYGWQQRVKYKMGNYRAKLRCRQLVFPELEVNSLRRRTSAEGSSKGIKKPKKAEVNYLPPLPLGETEDSLEKERLDLLQEVKKKNNEKIIGEKMEKSFSYRRMEVVEQCPAVQDVMERWPAMFSETQVNPVPVFLML